MFEFVPMGTELEPQEGKLALDVGNKVAPGILDHHHHVGKSCTVSLVMTHPEFIKNWVKGSHVTFVLHQSPDIDGTSAAYLAWRLLNDGELPYGLPILAEHIKAADQGVVEQPDPKAPLPYELYMIISSLIFEEYQPKINDLYQQLDNLNGDDDKSIAYKIDYLIQERDNKIVKRGFELLDFIFEKIQGIPEEEIKLRDIFRDVHPFKDECHALERDFELYTQDLHDHTKTRPFILKLPKKGTRIPVLVDGLYWVDPTPKLFKLWARSDHINAQVGDAFVFMMVEYSRGGKQGKPRYILSVDPNKSVDLVGLGSTLNHFEALKREEKGVVIDAPPRSGYDIPDPWYDGRGHDYTIVDTPIHGTILKRESIENYLRSFNIVDLFFRNRIKFAKVRYLFYFDFDSEGRKKLSSQLIKEGWCYPELSNQEIMSSLHQYFFNQSNHNKRQIVLHEYKFKMSGDRPHVKKLNLALSNQDTGVLSIDIAFKEMDMPSLFEWNSHLKLGFGLNELLDGIDTYGSEDAAKVIRQISELPVDSMVADYSSWSVKARDLHLSRDDSFYNHIMAAFMSNRQYPINIMQSDLENAKKYIELGQYGRIITRHSQSFCFMNEIDQEMSNEEQMDVWKIYQESCELVLMNASIQKTILDHILNQLTHSSNPDLSSRQLLDQLQQLRAKSMDMVNQGVFHNLSRNSLVMQYWDNITKEFKLDYYRKEVVSSIAELTEFVETNRSRSRERIVFILSVLVGPLTLLTDMMGNLLSDLYPGVTGFMGTVLVTYALAISVVAAIVLWPKLLKKT